MIWWHIRCYWHELACQIGWHAWVEWGEDRKGHVCGWCLIDKTRKADKST